MMRPYLLIMLASLLVVSCSIQKRRYNKGFHISKVVPINGVTSNVESKAELEVSPIVQKVKSEQKAEDIKQEISDSTYAQEKDVVEEMLDSIACDKVIFRDGHQEACIVKEVTPLEIKYKKCGFEEGPLYTVKVPEVSAILYRNGTKEFYGNYVKTTPYKGSEEYIDGYTSWANDPREIEIFSVLSIVFATIFFIPGLSIVFGVIGLRMFQKEPGKYKGKGFAYVGIGLGAAWVLLLLVLILLI